jgi:hypothetical protein
MSNQLDFAIIGVQKSATTWLYDCLKEHPGLDMKASKNEDYYYGGQNFREKGSDWYFGMFQHNGALKGCASVDYIVDADSPRLLHELNPNMKLIVALRNPSDRVASAYTWYLRKGFIPNLDLAEGLPGIIDRYRKGQSKPEEDLIHRGLYTGMLRRYLQYFPASQIQVLFYDEVKKQPAEVLRRVFSFLGVDGAFVPSNMNTVPKKNSQAKWLISLQRLAPNSKVMGKIADLLHQQLASAKPEAGKEGGKLPEPLRQALAEVYRQEVQQLSALLREQWGTLPVDPARDWK